MPQIIKNKEEQQAAEQPQAPDYHQYLLFKPWSVQQQVDPAIKSVSAEEQVQEGLDDGVDNRISVAGKIPERTKNIG
jgi:hypothetical protein